MNYDMKPLASAGLAAPVLERARTEELAASLPKSSVSWHLSPGYSTHLHAYELAMLPGDPRRSES